MPAYLVRLKSNHELVGVFVSPDEEDLAEFVDECTDPGVCEYVELPPGSIHFPMAGAPKVPTFVPDPEIDEAHPDWFRDGVLSELWLDIFYSERAAWEPVTGPEGYDPVRSI